MLKIWRVFYVYVFWVPHCAIVSAALTGRVGQAGPEGQVSREAQQDTISCLVVYRWQHRSAVLLAACQRRRLVRRAGNAVVTR